MLRTFSPIEVEAPFLHADGEPLCSSVPSVRRLVRVFSLAVRGNSPPPPSSTAPPRRKRVLSDKSSTTSRVVISTAEGKTQRRRASAVDRGWRGKKSHRRAPSAPALQISSEDIDGTSIAEDTDRIASTITRGGVPRGRMVEDLSSKMPSMTYPQDGKNDARPLMKGEKTALCSFELQYVNVHSVESDSNTMTPRRKKRVYRNAKVDREANKKKKRKKKKKRRRRMDKPLDSIMTTSPRAALWTTDEWNGSSMEESLLAKTASMLGSIDPCDLGTHSLFLPILGVMEKEKGDEVDDSVGATSLSLLMARHQDSLHHWVGTQHSRLSPFDRLRVAHRICRALCILLDHGIPFVDLCLHSVVMRHSARNGKDACASVCLSVPGLHALVRSNAMDVFHAAPEVIQHSMEHSSSMMEHASHGDEGGDGTRSPATVYSFGVILWELMMDTRAETLFRALASMRSKQDGRPCPDVFKASLVDGERVFPLPSTATLSRPRLVKLVHQCTSFDPCERPSMGTVLRRLTNAIYHIVLPSSVLRKAWKDSLRFGSRRKDGDEEGAAHDGKRESMHHIHHGGIFAVGWDDFVQHGLVGRMGAMGGDVSRWKRKMALATQQHGASPSSPSSPPSSPWMSHTQSSSTTTTTTTMMMMMASPVAPSSGTHTIDGNNSTSSIASSPSSSSSSKSPNGARPSVSIPKSASVPQDGAMPSMRQDTALSPSECSSALAVVALHAVFASPPHDDDGDGVVGCGGLGQRHGPMEMRVEWMHHNQHRQHAPVQHRQHESSSSLPHSIMRSHNAHHVLQKALRRDALARRGLLTNGRGGILTLESLVVMASAFPSWLMPNARAPHSSGDTSHHSSSSLSSASVLAGAKHVRWTDVTRLLVEEPLFVPIRTPAQAVGMLGGARTGTFLFRFDVHPGTFAASYVLRVGPRQRGSPRVVRHFRFYRSSVDGAWVALLPDCTARTAAKAPALEAFATLARLRTALVRRADVPLVRFIRLKEPFGVHKGWASSVEPQSASNGGVMAVPSTTSTSSSYKKQHSMTRIPQTHAMASPTTRHTISSSTTTTSASSSTTPAQAVDAGYWFAPSPSQVDAIMSRRWNHTSEGSASSSSSSSSSSISWVSPPSSSSSSSSSASSSMGSSRMSAASSGRSLALSAVSSSLFSISGSAMHHFASSDHHEDEHGGGTEGVPSSSESTPLAHSSIASVSKGNLDWSTRIESDGARYHRSVPAELRRAVVLAKDAVLRPPKDFLALPPRKGVLSDRRGVKLWVECYDGVLVVFECPKEGRGLVNGNEDEHGREGEKDSSVRHQRDEKGSVRLCTLLDGCRVVTKRGETRFKVATPSWKRSFVAQSASEAGDWVRCITQWASLTETLHVHGSFAPIRPWSRAHWLVDGADVFDCVARAIDGARHTVMITGWWLTPHVYMRRGSDAQSSDRLDKVMLCAARRGVSIYVMLWDEVSFAVKCVSSAEVCKRLNALHANIHTLRHPPITTSLKWSHHQKTVVVDHVVAFIGGVDLCVGRWDTPKHALRDDNHLHPVWPGTDYYNPEHAPLGPDLVLKPFKDQLDRDKYPRMPWHDVHTWVAGPGGWDVAANFVQRWNHHSRAAILEGVHALVLPPVECAIAASGPIPPWMSSVPATCDVQVLRSLSTWSGGHRVERSVMHAYLHAIDQAKAFIYIENQFFISSTGGAAISNAIAQALVDRIQKAHKEKKKFRVIVVLPAYPEGHFAKHADVRCMLSRMYDTVCRGKKSILRQLGALDIDHGEYITFHTLRTWQKVPGSPRGCLTNQIYVHSKMMVVDDDIAIIGSANINDRSLLGDRDSEIAILVRDTSTVDSVMDGKAVRVGTFPHTLRIALMAEHLGISSETQHMECFSPNGDGMGELQMDGAESSTSTRDGGGDSPSPSSHPPRYHRRHGVLHGLAEHPLVHRLCDPVHSDTYHRLWKATSHNNSMVYEAVFPSIPCDRITTLAKYKEAESKEKELWANDPEELMDLLSRVRGHVVDLPRHFLKDQSVSTGVEDLHLKLLHDVQDTVFL